MPRAGVQKPFAASSFSFQTMITKKAAGEQKGTVADGRKRPKISLEAKQLKVDF